MKERILAVEYAGEQIMESEENNIDTDITKQYVFNDAYAKLTQKKSLVQTGLFEHIKM